VNAAGQVIKMNILDQLADEMDAYFFSYAQTPLLVINTTDIGPVQESRQLEEFIDLIQNARAGVQHCRPFSTA
jgi:hypothetical protein